MFKVMIAAAAAVVLLLAGCAAPSAGVGSTGAGPTGTWNSPFPEQPGNNRWGRPAPA